MATGLNYLLPQDEVQVNYVEISPEEVRVGDVVVSFTRRNDIGWGLPFPGHPITKIGKHRNLDYLFIRNPPYPWIQMQCHLPLTDPNAGDYNVTKLRILPRVMTGDAGRYPHICPACKQACYIGFTSIEHASGRCKS